MHAMRTDAKDLALSLFLRSKEKSSCEHQKENGGGERESTCDDGPHGVAPGVGVASAAQGSMAMKVYNTELIHRK